jgi:hypothetical protein
MNVFQLGVMHGLGWLFVLFDGWVWHSHWLAGAGFIFLTVSLWRMRLIKEPEDDEFDRIQREQDMKTTEGWRKRQIMARKTNFESFDDWEHSHRPDQYWIERRAYLAGFDAGARHERQKRECND